MVRLSRAWRLLRAVTCLSCGAPYGQPHRAGCAFGTVAS